MAALSSGIVDTFTFNAGGQRVGRTDTTGSVNYVWDGQNVLIETNASNAIEAVHTLEPRYFGNQVSQFRSGVASYYHYDLQGSTLHLTNAAGTLTNTYVYNAWGETLSSSGSTVNPYQYIGRKGYIFDTDLGNYHVRARRYGTYIGRWWSRDPIGFAGGDANLYRYVGNGPTASSDPGGLISIYFEGTGQPYRFDPDQAPSRSMTALQSLFAYSDDPLSFLSLNRNFSYDRSEHERRVNQAVNISLDARLMNPKEKIYLYGWSRGGCQALDVAARLKKMNISVQFLGVIDPVSTPVYFPFGMFVNSNVQNFFIATRTGHYWREQNPDYLQDILGDYTIFTPMEVFVDYGSMTTAQQKSMILKQYQTSHRRTGFPGSVSSIYDDLLKSARSAGAPYPAGPLPASSCPKPKGAAIN